MQKKPIIIAIDGFSSCGKSTVAKDLAKQLKFAYIDTGAMYRAVTLYAIQNKLIKDRQIDQAELQLALNNIKVTFHFDSEKKQNSTYLNEVNVEKLIRGLEVSRLVSSVSALAFVRHHLVDLQREIGKEGNVIMDGRDIGTVVFPNADLKIFMTALPDIRAKRRFDELATKKDHPSYDEILDNVIQRDHLDSTRKVSPLRRADDSIELDNSYLTKEEQLEWIIEQLQNKDLI